MRGAAGYQESKSRLFSKELSNNYALILNVFIQTLKSDSIARYADNTVPYSSFISFSQLSQISLFSYRNLVSPVFHVFATSSYYVVY